MVSLIGPYFLTFLGLMVDSAHDFPAFAVVFTAAGVLWTAGRGLAKESGGKAIALMVAGHGAIWLLFKFKPEMLGAAIGIAIGLAFAVPVALIGWSVVIRPLFFGGSSAPAFRGGAEDAAPGGRGTLPNIIYDDSNARWQLRHRNGDGSAVYYSDDGREVLIHLNYVSGTTANTGEGTFHWY